MQITINIDDYDLIRSDQTSALLFALADHISLASERAETPEDTAAAIAKMADARVGYDHQLKAVIEKRAKGGRNS